jgi:hypothetical protein
MNEDIVSSQRGGLKSIGKMERSQRSQRSWMGKQHSTDDVNATAIPRSGRAQPVYVGT